MKPIRSYGQIGTSERGGQLLVFQISFPILQRFAPANWQTSRTTLPIDAARWSQSLDCHRRRGQNSPKSNRVLKTHPEDVQM